MRVWWLLALTGCTVAEGAPKASAEMTYASDSFWQRWGDGQAELAGYTLTTPRYGELRAGTAVLITVTEPHDDRTWIKDDRVSGSHRVDVLKLNHVEHFQTGIYDYDVMTSVFSPVHGPGERFQPTRVRMSAQEWCGHVYTDWTLTPQKLQETMHSYFASEGDAERELAVGDVLYEDALYIQLRELDGPFAAGGDWSGKLVPRAWYQRRDHRDTATVDASITRAQAERDGQAVTRFTLTAGRRTKTFDVGNTPDRPLLGWSSSDGEEAVRSGVARLPYWQLAGEGQEAMLGRIGLR